MYEKLLSMLVLSKDISILLSKGTIAINEGEIL